MQKKLFEDEADTVEERKVHPKNSLNDLTGKEWIQETVSVWFQRGLGKEHPHVFYERQHPAPFPYLMVERLLRFFTKKNDFVLDPFNGVGSTLKACANLNRKGIGIELIDKWIQLSKERLAKETKDPSQQKIIKGDARKAISTFKDNYFDFMVTSPPYWKILNKPADHRVKGERIKDNLATNYSENSEDLANINNYDEFLIQLQKVWQECHRVLKPGKFMTVVIGDFRDKSRYVAYHSDIIRTMEKSGFLLKGITIFVQNAKKVYPYGYPYDFVPNIHHQYLLIFKKSKINA